MNTQVAVTAFRKTSTSWGPVFFTNYVHGTGLEETKEYAGRRLIHNCQLWQAAAVSAATPPLFRPQTVGMFYLLILILIFFLFFEIHKNHSLSSHIHSLHSHLSIEFNILMSIKYLIDTIHIFFL
jgi:hypothetical protein